MQVTCDNNNRDDGGDWKGPRWYRFQEPAGMYMQLDKNRPDMGFLLAVIHQAILKPENSRSVLMIPLDPMDIVLIAP